MKKVQKLPIKIGDQVKVISGSYKNNIGEVTKIYKKTGKIIITGVNLKTKHLKPKTSKDIGKIVQFESPIHHSNVKVN